MKRLKSNFLTTSLGIILLCIINSYSKESNSTTLSTSSTEEDTIPHNGTFFSGSFYKFSEFKSLEMVSLTNHNKTYDGSATDSFSDEDIADYNDDFETISKSSVFGVKLGYDWNNGFSLYGSIGAMEFFHESWENSDGNTIYRSKYPGISMGLEVEYDKVIYKGLSGFFQGGYNFSSTKSTIVDNESVEDITESKFMTHTWDINLGLAYRLGRILPYIGTGYTQTYQNVAQTETILTELETGAPYNDSIESEAKYKQLAFYGFGGAYIELNSMASIYVRASFVDPFQGSVGFKINIAGRAENEK